MLAGEFVIVVDGDDLVVQDASQRRGLWSMAAAMPPPSSTRARSWGSQACNSFNSGTLRWRLASSGSAVLGSHLLLDPVQPQHALQRLDGDGVRAALGHRVELTACVCKAAGLDEPVQLS